MARVDEFKRRIEALEAQRLYARVKPPGESASLYELNLYAVVRHARNSGRVITQAEAEDAARCLSISLEEMDAMDSPR